MAILKQSTVYTRLFLMIDSTDHITGKTGLTVVVTLSKAGGAFGAAGGTVTEVSSGWYKIALTTTDTNTLGDLAYHCAVAGADATDFVDTVSVRIIDDLAFPTTSGRSLDVTTTGEAGIDWSNIGAPTTSVNLSGTTIATTQQVDVNTIKTNPVVNAGTITFPTTATLASTTNITAGTVTTATNVTTVNGIANNAITAASIATDAIDADALAADAVTEIWAKGCTEPTAVVAASPTVIAALSWLLTLSRNTLTQTSTTQIIKADDTTTTIATSTISDNGTTFTRGEFA